MKASRFYCALVLIAAWAVAFAFAILIFALTVARTYHAIKLERQVRIRSSLASILLRDGM